MAIFSSRRRLLGIRPEGTSGTLNQPNLTANIDNTPLLRDAKMAVEPISVERPTLRLTYTPIGDIYPGKSVGTLTTTFELSSSSLFIDDATTGGERSNILRWIQACFYEVNRSAGEAANIRGIKVTGITTDNGPMRHGEALIGTGVVLGNGWTAVGDNYVDDEVLFLTSPAGTLTGGSLTGANGTVFTVNNASLGDAGYCWSPRSDINAAISGGVAHASLALYDDGKLWLMKGAMGNFEFEFKHGDAVLVNMTMRGVVDSYTDAALPTGALDNHRYPPTFLGSRVTIRKPTNNPATADRYGTGGTGAAAPGGGTGITGSLNSIKLRSGNNLVLHENSMDPNGINYALISSRAPEGEFNPDEVLNTEFPFVNYFAAGNPLRMRITVVGSPAGSFVFNDPTTANNNVFDFMVGGLVISGLGDGDRDGINSWNGRFKCTGGNYSTTAQIETPGIDNEIVIIQR